MNDRQPWRLASAKQMADNLHINLERLSVYLFILFSVLINKHMFEFMAILEPWIGQNTFKLL